MKERNRLNETFDLDAMLKILLLWTIFWNSHIISSDTDNFVVCIIQYLARQKYQCKQQQMWRRNIQAKAEIPHSQQILGIFPLLALQLLLPTNVLTDLDCNRWSKIRSFFKLGQKICEGKHCKPKHRIEQVSYYGRKRHLPILNFTSIIKKTIRKKEFNEKYIYWVKTKNRKLKWSVVLLGLHIMKDRSWIVFQIYSPSWNSNFATLC